MGLYYSLGFFVYILGYLAVSSGFKSPTVNKVILLDYIQINLSLLKMSMIYPRLDHTYLGLHWLVLVSFSRSA